MKLFVQPKTENFQPANSVNNFTNNFLKTQRRTSACRRKWRSRSRMHCQTPWMSGLAEWSEPCRPYLDWFLIDSTFRSSARAEAASPTVHRPSAGRARPAVAWVSGSCLLSAKAEHERKRINWHHIGGYKCHLSSLLEQSISVIPHSPALISCSALRLPSRSPCPCWTVILPCHGDAA